MFKFYCFRNPNISWLFYKQYYHLRIKIIIIINFIHIDLRENGSFNRNISVFSFFLLKKTYASVMIKGNVQKMIKMVSVLFLIIRYFKIHVKLKAKFNIFSLIFTKFVIFLIMLILLKILIKLYSFIQIYIYNSNTSKNW